MCDPQNPRPYWDMLWELLMVHTPTVRQMEAAMTLVAMVKSGGLQTEAAKILGMNRKTLNYKLPALRAHWELQLQAIEDEEQRQFQYIRDSRRDRHIRDSKRDRLKATARVLA